MSNLQAENEAPSEVVIVDSTLTCETSNYTLCSIPEKTIRLKAFPDAHWKLTIGGYWQLSNTQFRFEIVNFPGELHKDCFTEFSVALEGYEVPIISQKLPFQSIVSFLPNLPRNYRVSGTASFTANFVVTKKVSTSMKKVSASTVDLLQKSLLASISDMYASESVTDFIFIVGNKRFKVHKLILAASSVVMLRMFTVNDIEPDIFEALIRFMYSCTVPENLKDIAFDLYAAAHYYEVETLKKICLDEIQNNLSTKNVTKSYALAFKYDLEKLVADAWIIIKRDILVNCPLNVKPMPPDEIAKILEIRKKKDDEVQAVFSKYTIPQVRINQVRDPSIVAIPSNYHNFTTWKNSEK